MICKHSFGHPTPLPNYSVHENVPEKNRMRRWRSKMISKSIPVGKRYPFPCDWASCMFFFQLSCYILHSVDLLGFGEDDSMMYLSFLLKWSESLYGRVMFIEQDKRCLVRPRCLRHMNNPLILLISGGAFLV